MSQRFKQQTHNLRENQQKKESFDIDGLSRRGLLKTLSGGLGMALGSPLLAQSISPKSKAPSRGLGANSPSANLDWTVAVPVKPADVGAGPGAFVEGKIIYCGGTIRGPIVFNDAQAGQQLYVTNTYYSTLTCTPKILNNLVYLGGDPLIEIDAVSQTVNSIYKFGVVGDITVYNDSLIFGSSSTSNLEVVSYNPATKTSNWSYKTSNGSSFISAPILSNNGLVVLLTDSIITLDPNTGAPIWPQPVAASPTALSSGVVAGGYIHYIDSNNANVVAVDLFSGQQVWTWSNGNSLANIEADGGTLCVSDGNGLLTVLVIGPGQNGKGELAFPAITVGHPTAGMTSELYIEDGIAYLSFEKVYAVDLTSQGEKVVAFATPDTSVPRVLGVENGVCYFTYSKGQHLGAVDLANQIHSFFCESQLAADDYASNSSNTNGYQPSTSWYNSHIQLLDPSACPRANKSVKITVSANATLVVNGQQTNLTTSSAVWATTDGSGELTIAVQATDLSCPSVNLWGSFMDQGESIVIYPDREMVDQLSAVNSGTLTQATTFNGSLMLQGDSVGSAGHLANAITQTMGSPPSYETQNKYIAYPDGNKNIVYQPAAGSTNRAYNGGNVNWSLQITATGGVTYQTTSGAGSQSANSIVPPGFPRRGGGPSLGVQSDDLDSFFKNVVHGTDRIASMAWTAIENGATAVIKGIEGAYTISIAAVEHALIVVGGILKSVLNDVFKAVQWLSYLFDWKAFLQVKDQIKQVVITAGQNLVGFTFTADAITAVHNFFQDAENNVTNAFNNAISHFGGSTPKGQQVNGNDPQVIYGPKGGKSYSPTRWITNKIKTNSSNGQIVSSLTAAGTAGPYDDAIAAVATVIQSVTDALKDSNLAHVPQDLWNTLKSFSSLLTHPDQFVSNSLGAILQLFEDIVVGLLQLLDAIIESLLAALPKLLLAAVNMVQQQISIPVVDDLWRAISGAPLSLLDLFALVIAIPTRIISLIIPPQSTAQSAGKVSTESNTIEGYAIIFGGAIYAIFDSFSALLGDENFDFGAYITLVLTVLLLIPNFPFTTPPDKSLTWIMFALSTLPIAMSVTSILASRGAEKPAWAQYWNQDSNSVSAFYGFSFIGAAIYAALEDSANFGGAVLADNIFSNFPYVAQYFATGAPVTPTRIGVAALTGVCDLTGSGLSASMEWGS